MDKVEKLESWLIENFSSIIISFAIFWFGLIAYGLYNS